MLFREDTRKINFKMLAKVIGWLLMIESGFMLIPFIVALIYHESDWQPFAAATVVTFLSGLMLNNCIRPKRYSMAKREGFLLTALIWIVFSLFGMIPFIFCSTPLSVGNAFFEAMAGFTTTGSSAYENINFLSRSVFIWRTVMQWIGGMGIILFTLAVLPMLNSSGGMQMFNAEVTGITHEKIRPRISETAKGLWMIYIGLTLLCCVLLWLGPMSFFDSACHAMATLSTGGYSTAANGPAQWQSTYVDVVITIFMFLGGTSFVLIFFAFSGKFSAVKANVTFRTYVGILCSAIFFIALCRLVHLGHDATWQTCLVGPMFQAVAVATSTGFVLPSLPTWAPFALGILMPLMVFGACAGSTSGGAKVDRLIVLSKFVRNSLKRAILPNSITSVEIDGHVLSRDIVTKTVAFLSLYAIVICSGALALTACGLPIFDSFFNTASCMTNLGIGADMFGGSVSISSLPIIAKMILASVMLIGRLEVFTILVLFTSAFWRR